MVCSTGSTAERGNVFQDAQKAGLYTQKKSYLYQERSLAARAAFAQELRELSPERCVYIDEAGVENTLDYAYGELAPTGRPLVVLLESQGQPLCC